MNLTYRSFWLAALACGCVLVTGLLGRGAGAAEDPGRDRQFDELLASTARADPDAPAVLEERLQHIEGLLKAPEGRCETGLGQAQAELDAVSHRAAVTLLMPLGAARLANLSYQLYRAKAACLGDPAAQDAQLRLALEAAQHGVERYRYALDYPSMAVMQFNIAATFHSLGEETAAVAALAAAIDMDHEFGLSEDAQENEHLMQQWRPDFKPAAPALDEAPPRSVSLKFGWHESDAQTKIEVNVAYLSQGKTGQATTAKGVAQQVRQVRGEWHVKRDLSAQAGIDGHGFEGQDVFHGLVLPVAEAIVAQPDIAIDAKGAFRAPQAGDRLSTQIVRVARGMMSQATGKSPSITDVHRLYDAFSPDTLWAQSEETYNLETGAWIGAQLEQGTWYRTQASLRLAGMTDWFLPHDIEFAYTRDVPCTSTAESPKCVEIVIHATPEPQALDQFTLDLSNFTRVMHYWSSSYICLVTDPQTLTPYRLDVRRYWHIVNREFQREPASGMDQVVTTFTYRAPAAAADGPS